MNQGAWYASQHHMRRVILGHDESLYLAYAGREAFAAPAGRIYMCPAPFIQQEQFINDAARSTNVTQRLRADQDKDSHGNYGHQSAQHFRNRSATATVAAWHKRKGESVSRDELLVDIETDKVVIEVVAPEDGTS